jgi:hypothetical protein
MIYTLLFFQLVATVSLILIGYHRPDALRSSSFPFTRKCLGITLLAFAIAAMSVQCAGWRPEAALVISLVAQGVAWIFLIFVYRGIFEVLSNR